MPYFIVSILAIVLGQFSGHLCKKMPDWVSEKITFKEYLHTLKSGFRIDIIYSVVYLILFNLLVYVNGYTYLTYVYILCIFSLLIVFNIDYKYELIPDECHILIAVAGIINLAFNLANWKSYLLGSLIGGGAFYLLGVLALIIYKKEGMGFGDVKLMAALGFLFGVKKILVITILSFAIAAVISIILIAFKVKKLDSYLPFGPFIVISTLLVMYFDVSVFINLYYSLCMWLGTGITDIVFKIIGNN